MKILYNQLENEFEDELDEEFFLEGSFDNSFDDKQYILHGTIGCWDGTRYGFYPKLLNSLLDCIIKAEENYSQFYTKIYEANYGRFYIEISHHDGHDVLEAREVTKLGEEMYNNYHDIDKILKTKYATKNAKYCKNYL